MTETSWERYGLIAGIARGINDKSLGKTKLQKLVFLMQELEQLPQLYRFHFYTYGPYSSDLSGDVGYMEAVDGLRIARYTSNNAWEIAPGDEAQTFLDSAEPFLAEHRDAVDTVINQFGHRNAGELELIATLVYVMHYDPCWQPTDRSYLVDKVKELKPKFSDAEIRRSIEQLETFGYVPDRAPAH